jgi:hypothetical protein
MSNPFQEYRKELDLMLPLVFALCVLLAVISWAIDKQILELFKLAAEGIFFVLSSVFLFYGANTWFREHLGKKRLDVTTKLVTEVYKFQDAVIRFRSSAASGISGEANQIEKFRHYEPWFSKLESRLDSLYELIPLTKVYCAEDFRPSANELKVFFKDLSVSVHMWIIGDPKHPEFEKDFKIAVHQWEKPDEFQTKLEATVEKIVNKYLEKVT